MEQLASLLPMGAALGNPDDRADEHDLTDRTDASSVDLDIRGGWGNSSLHADRAVADGGSHSAERVGVTVKPGDWFQIDGAEYIYRGRDRLATGCLLFESVAGGMARSIGRGKFVAAVSAGDIRRVEPDVGCGEPGLLSRLVARSWPFTEW